jgi:hypothetical protein
VLLAIALLLSPVAAAVSFEQAGPGGAVRGVTGAGSGVAGVVVWEPPGLVRDLPSGTFSVAARALLDHAAEELGGGRGLLRVDAEGLAAGVVFDAAEGERLARWLERIAAVPELRTNVIEQALRERLEEVEARWADPTEVARLTARASASPAWRLAERMAGRPRSMPRIGVAEVRRALAALREAPVRVDATGPSGLAATLAARLEGRLAGAGAGEQQPGPGPQAVAVLAPSDPAQAARVGLALAVRVPEKVLAEQRAPLAVLLEALSEGRGSLAQRLAVALGRDASPRIEWHAGPGGGGLVTFSIEVAREEAQDGWLVLSGATRSVSEQRFLNVAALGARRRLDERAQAWSGADAERVLAAARDGRLSWWPPSDRWSRPIGPDELLAVARMALGPDHRYVAAAGALPLDLLRREPLASGARIGVAGLCPERADLTCPVEEPLGGLDDSAREREGRRRARALLERLRVEGADQLPPRGFRAEYEVLERTPLGDVPVDLIVESSTSGVAVQWRSEEWGLSAWTTEEGVDVRVDGEAPREAAVAGLDRIESFALREPIVMTSAVLDGLVPAMAVDLSCSDDRCPGLEAFLAEGSRLALILDPESLEPLEARLWWRGAGPPQPADEILTFESWTVVDGFRLVERSASRTNGTGSPVPERSYRLVSWEWASGDEEGGD